MPSWPLRYPSIRIRAPGGVPIFVVRVIARPDRSTSTWIWHRGCSNSDCRDAEKRRPSRSGVPLEQPIPSNACPQAAGSVFSSLPCHVLTGGLRPAGPPYAVARGAPDAPLRSGGALAFARAFGDRRLRPAGPPYAVARGAPDAPLRSGEALAFARAFGLGASPRPPPPRLRRALACARANTFMCGTGGSHAVQLDTHDWEVRASAMSHESVTCFNWEGVISMYEARQTPDLGG